MPFGGLWKKVAGDSIVPTSGINTLRIPDADEYAFLERTPSVLILDSGAGSDTVRIKVNDATRVQAGTSSCELYGGGNVERIRVDDTGIGFFGSSPVAKQSKPANPTTDPASLQTAVQALIDALGNYALIG